MKRIKIQNKYGKDFKFLRSKELSLSAKGLMAMLVYGGFVLSVKDNDVLRETLEELQALDYIKFDEITDNGQKYFVISQKKY